MASFHEIEGYDESDNPSNGWREPEINPSTFMPFDIVRIGRHQMIIVRIEMSRPVNQFVGIKVNGNGAEYVFGIRNKPVKVDHALTDHPAIIAWQKRKLLTASTTSSLSGFSGIDDGVVAAVCHLLDAVEKGDMQKAKILAAVVRTIPQFSDHTS